MSRSKGKLTKGQPQGNRSASGRKRDRAPRLVEPSIGVARRRDFYNMVANDTDMSDAIGRAFVAGLLGTGNHAQKLLNAGRRIHAQYWRHYGSAEPGLSSMSDSLARFQPRLGGGQPDPERDRLTEEALNAGLALIEAKGRNVRRAFDLLVIDWYPDYGPAWLDRIIYARRRGQPSAETDADLLRLALFGLESIA